MDNNPTKLPAAVDSVSDRLEAPGPSPEVEAEKRVQLRRAKVFATMLLVIATVVYFTRRGIESSHVSAGEVVPAWVGYVCAASEAGTVGALADWFAAAALFRRSLGIPILYTAIVRRKKDQVGESLAQLVGDDFLNPALIVDKVRKAEIPERTNEWLVAPGNADKVPTEVGKFTRNVPEVTNPDDAVAMLKSAVIGEVVAPEWGPPAGKVLEQLIKEGCTEPIVQQMAEWLYRKSLGSQNLIDRLIGKRVPSWAPSFVNDLIGDKVYRESVGRAWQVQHDPKHDTCLALHRFLTQLSIDLQDGEKTTAKVEKAKTDILSSTAVTQAPARIWASTPVRLVDAVRDPDSLLRRKVSGTIARYGERIQSDPELRKRMDRCLEVVVVFIAEDYAGEITSIISETVERWDVDEASDKIELIVGRDLQFIRVNGTVVGSLAGLVIYILSTLVFGATQ